MSLGACLSFMPYHVPYSIRHLAKHVRASLLPKSEASSLVITSKQQKEIDYG